MRTLSSILFVLGMLFASTLLPDTRAAAADRQKSRESCQIAPLPPSRGIDLANQGITTKDRF